MARNSITFEQWLEKAYAYHGHKYNYDKVVWKGLKTKVIITCPIHGDFEQLPWAHTNSKRPAGCRQCANENNRIQQRKYSHASINDILYDMNPTCRLKTGVEYKRINLPLEIYCTTHDYYFKRSLSSILAHTDSKVCPKCQAAYKRSTNMLSSDALKQNLKALDSHDTIDFPDNVVYDKGTQGKYTFICKKHGEFESWYSRIYESLKAGNNGCPICAYEKYSTCNCLPSDIALAKMQETHHRHYSYNMLTYKCMSGKMEIICPKHGVFLMSPSTHMKGCGCPKCSTSKMENDLIQYFDIHQINYVHQYKANWLGKQSLDFYLLDYKVAIECQGEQHFESVEWFGGKDGFTYRQKMDQRKLQLCKENNVKLLYYSNLLQYTEFLNEPLYHNITELLKMIKN